MNIWKIIIPISCLLFACKAQAGNKVSIDGSSTVAPISMATAELFQMENRGVQVTVGVSGTGGGFKKFLDSKPSLRTDINDASRPIKSKEIEKATSLGIEFVEIPIAIDGLAVVVHPRNNWCNYLTIDELKRIWEPGSQINNWSQVREGFPDVPLKLYGPGTDSGTFDYFVETVCGGAKKSRDDYTASENDNVLVNGVAGNRGGLGYFGFSYYEANKRKIKVLGIAADSSVPPVVPSMETISNGTYRPLSRPLFLYINAESLDKPEVVSFLDYFLDNAKMIVEHRRVNYVALSDKLYEAVRNRIKSRVTGSVYGHSDAAEKSLDDLYLR